MKTAALFACLMFTAGVLPSCEREPSIPEKITAIYSALNELDQDIKRLGSRTDTLESISVGEGHRSNMAGYLTAGAVSQDAFNVAMADLMSSLSAVPTA
jgi:hypothetical protein